jgi:predicted nucleotidyltransferase
MTKVDKIRQLTIWVKSRYPDVNQIILFGSSTRDSRLPSDDVDLLIVTKKALSKREKSYIAAQLYRELKVPIDLLQCSIADFNQNKHEDPFLREIVRSGIAL